MNGQVALIPGREMSEEALDRLEQLRFPESTSIKDKIVTTLRIADRPLDAKTIAAATGLTKKQVWANLSFIIKSSKYNQVPPVIKEETGLYRIRRATDPVTTPYTAPKERKDIRDIKPKRQYIANDVIKALQSAGGSVGPDYIADKVGGEVTPKQAYQALLRLSKKPESGVVKGVAGMFYFVEPKVMAKKEPPTTLEILEELTDGWLLLRDTKGTFYRAEPVQLAITTLDGEVLKVGLTANVQL